MSSGREALKISLESVGSTLSDRMPTFVWNSGEQSNPRNCTHESLQKSFVFVSENGDAGDSGSIVVLGKSSLDDVRTQSLASYEEIHQKSMALDCQSIISSLLPEELEKKVTELLQENLRLKETLKQNSLAMKTQLIALASRQEELTNVHDAHRQKFTLTKNLVSRLKLENEELRAKYQSQVEKINEIERQDQCSQTVNEKERTEPETSIDNEFAAEMLKLAEKTEEQAKEIAHLRTIIGSLNRQLEPAYLNLFTEIKLDDVQSSSESSENTDRQHFIKSFTHYNEKLRALGNCYAAQASRYTIIQECLQRCSEILSEKRESACTTSDDSRESLESQKYKELQNHRSKLIDEELKSIVERQEMIQAQNEFKTIFTRYNSTLLELESLREEIERSKSLQRGVSLHDERLDVAKANLRESEELLERQRLAMEHDRAELSKQKQALERERLSLQKEERNLIEANASLNEELVSMRETNDVLRSQLKIYEDDYADELKLRENMIAEKNDLIKRITRLENERQVNAFADDETND